MIMPALQQVRQLIPTSVACQLLGVARSSLYRWEHPTYGPSAGATGPGAPVGVDRAGT